MVINCFVVLVWEGFTCARLPVLFDFKFETNCPCGKSIILSQKDFFDKCHWSGFKTINPDINDIKVKFSWNIEVFWCNNTKNNQIQNNRCNLWQVISETHESFLNKYYVPKTMFWWNEVLLLYINKLQCVNFIQKGNIKFVVVGLGFFWDGK